MIQYCRNQSSLTNPLLTMSEFTSQITFLPCKNLDETEKFYVEFLGFKKVTDQGSCRIYQSTSNAFLGFCLKQNVPSSEGTILTLITEDVDLWAQQIEEHGWPIEVAPRINERFQIYQCFLRDPNGHLIEIQRFLHPFP